MCFLLQDKVYEELHHIFQGSNRSTTMQDLNKMKYLERVIKEALRLYPSVPFIGRILKEDTQIGTAHIFIYRAGLAPNCYELIH
jgi:cytochrome P450